ncbi:MAG: hypothetical protein OXB84_03380, partial [Halobacteriovoraceae bacterium]|nr:hypothetical protein [Halobacteriovoraceae bacterium]
MALSNKKKTTFKIKNIFNYQTFVIRLIKVFNIPSSKIKSFISFYWPLLFLGITLFAHHAWVNGFFHDGYLYATMGKNAALKGFWLIPHYTEEFYGRFHQHLPLVFILEGVFFKIFGASNVTARLFIGGFSLATLTVLILWIFNLKGEKGKWWACMSPVVFLLTLPVLKQS